MSQLRSNSSLAAKLGVLIGAPAARRQPRAAATAPAQSGLLWARKFRRKLRITDAVIIVVVVALSADIVYHIRPPANAFTTTKFFLLFALTSVLWLAMMAVFRTRDAHLLGVGAGEYKRVLHASAATFGWLGAAYLLFDPSPARGYFLLAMPIGGVSLVMGRWLWRGWLTTQRQFGHFLSKVVVLGPRADVEYVIAQIDKKSGATYQVQGAVLEDESDTSVLHVGSRVVPIVGVTSDVSAAVEATGADAVIVAGQLSSGSGYLRELGWKLEATSTELVVASSLTNVAGPRIQMRPVEGLPLMHVELPQFSGGRHVLKRVMDIVVSGIALIVLSPMLLVLSIWIRRDSEGGVIFRQTRVGQGSRQFTMYKFRSMVQSAEEELAQLKLLNEGAGPLFKLHDDPRVTKVGGQLRKYSLDEFPQLLNVFKGDMSLVGPRPPLPSEVQDYRGHTHRRLFIKPGLTGLWQINGRSDLDWEESVRLDLYYVENWSITGDLMIMWRTLKIMLKPVGAY